MGNQTCCAGRTPMFMVNPEVEMAHSIVKSERRSFGTSADCIEFEEAWYSSQKDYPTLIKLILSTDRVVQMKRVVPELPQCESVGQAVLLHLSYLMSVAYDSNEIESPYTDLINAGLIRALSDALSTGDVSLGMHLLYFLNILLYYERDETLPRALVDVGLLEKLVPFIHEHVIDPYFLVNSVMSLSFLYDSSVETKLRFSHIKEAPALLTKTWRHVSQASNVGDLAEVTTYAFSHHDEELDQEHVLVEVAEKLKKAGLEAAVKEASKRMALDEDTQAEVNLLLEKLKVV